MSCCGEKRAALTAQLNARRSRSPAPDSGVNALPVPSKTPDVLLRYLGERDLALRGPQSDRVYVFIAGGEAVPVDPGDADAFLSSHLFVFAGNKQPPGGT